MTMTLELPEAGIDETPRPHLHVTEESREAAEAAKSLESGETPDQELLTVRLLKPIDDSINDFHAPADTTYTAYVDEEGDTYIPIPVKLGRDEEDGRVYLEAEEFEVVTELQGEEEEEQTEPAAGGCDRGSVDQPAPGQPQAEPATPPGATNAPPKLSPRERYLRDKAAMEERLAGLTIEEMKLKEQAKLCKKEREVLAEQLSNLIDGWERGPAPDAAEPEPATAGGAVETASEGQPTAETTVGSVDPAGQLPAAVATPVAETDQDRQARYQRVLEAADIKELSLPKAIEERLVESAVGNLWALEMLRDDISQGKAKWPKGVGEAKVTKIETAMSEWVARNRATWAPSQRAEIAAADAAEESAAAPTRTPAEIAADNQRIADQQEDAQDAEVAAAGVSPPVAKYDPLDDL